MFSPASSLILNYWIIFDPIVRGFGVCGAFWDWMGGLLLELDFEYGVVLGLVPVDFPTSSNLLLW